MKYLLLERFAYTPFGTFGRLRVMDEQNTKFECFTVEPRWVNNEVGKSCVPVGTYALALEYSPRFGRNLWELKGVPGRSEAKLHPANLAKELEGCIAPGTELGSLEGEWAVVSSSYALQKIMGLMIGQETSTIYIKNAPVQGELDVTKTIYPAAA